MTEESANSLDLAKELLKRISLQSANEAEFLTQCMETSGAIIILALFAVVAKESRLKTMEIFLSQTRKLLENNKDLLS